MACAFIYSFDERLGIPRILIFVLLTFATAAYGQEINMTEIEIKTEINFCSFFGI